MSPHNDVCLANPINNTRAATAQKTALVEQLQKGYHLFMLSPEDIQTCGLYYMKPFPCLGCSEEVPAYFLDDHEVNCKAEPLDYADVPFLQPGLARDNQPLFLHRDLNGLPPVYQAPLRAGRSMIWKDGRSDMTFDWNRAMVTRQVGKLSFERVA
eukprot:199247-Heterocapsa_arctica.AAC.1